MFEETRSVLLSSTLETKEVFQDLPSLRVFIIEEFRMKLDSEERSLLVLHRLDGARFVEGGATKALG